MVQNQRKLRCVPDERSLGTRVMVAYECRAGQEGKKRRKCNDAVRETVARLTERGRESGESRVLDRSCEVDG